MSLDHSHVPSSYSNLMQVCVHTCGFAGAASSRVPCTVPAVLLRRTAECAECHVPASALWPPSGRWPRPSSGPGAAPQDPVNMRQLLGTMAKRPCALVCSCGVYTTL